MFTHQFTAALPTDAASCNKWLAFQGAVGGSFRGVTLRGSNDAVGRTCNTPSAATSICNALRNNAAATVACDGHTWYVGECGPTPGAVSWEISVDTGYLCGCPTGYVARPCIDAYDGPNANWGGVNSATCGGPTQIMDVICY